MKGLFAVIVVLLAVIAGLGFYQGWFHVSSDTADQKSNMTFTVGRDKIREDEGKAKEKMHDLGESVKGKIGGRTEKATEPERRP